MTNILDPEEGAVRLAMLAATASMLVVSLAVPGAFGSNGVTFGVAYFVVRGLLLVLFAIDPRGRRRRETAPSFEEFYDSPPHLRYRFHTVTPCPPGRRNKAESPR